MQKKHSREMAPKTKKSKKCAIFCTALWKFVLLRNALQFVGQGFCDKFNMGFVVHFLHKACAPASI